MRRIRLAAVSFLNTRPITFGLEQGLGSDRFELTYHLPSRCAAAVQAGEADLGLMPIASYAASAQALRIVPGVAIASRGTVGTVLLVGHVPWEDMDTVVLDEASRTSQLLVKLLAPRRQTPVRYESDAHERVAERARGSTGALVIGDLCFTAAGRFPFVYDLGERWTAQTGLPFVYAAWIGRPDAIGPEDVALLQQSLTMGLGQRRSIARAWAAQSGVAPARCEHYLEHNIHYHLGAAELCGASTYLERAFAAKLVDERRLLRFYPPDDCRTDVRAEPSPAARGDGATGTAAPAGRSIDSLLAAAAQGTRLSFDDGLSLLERAPLADLGRAADTRRKALHPEGVVTYIVDRNVNYTNACTTACQFCNFYHPPGDDRVYTLSRDELAQKLQETLDLGGVQVLLQGGINPALGLDYYEELFRWMKRSFPKLAIHGLSPEEINYLAKRDALSVPGVIERLMAAGLDSIPGGAAEILDDEIRQRISPNKCSVEEWLFVMREAHRLGLQSTATMVFGFGEEPRHLVGHLQRIRTLQDQTAGFTAFICWSFQAEGTKLPLRDDTSAARYLRVLALARLYLDNFPNVQVSWVTMGPAVGQIGLRFGANDFGSAMIEENVVSRAGAVFKLSSDDIERHIRAAGFSPRRRNMRYAWLSG